MQEVTNWGTLFYNSLQAFGQKMMGSVPYILGAILILVIGWLIAKSVAAGVKKLLEISQFDKLAQKAKAQEILDKANISLTPSGIVGKFVYWIVMLLVITSAADSLGWTIVSAEISKLMAYLPKLFVAIVIFIVGSTIVSIIRDVIRGATSSMGIATGKFISEFVFYLLFIVVVLTALGQAGIDTSIITSNMLLILGAILVTASISYGFASRDILSNILASYFNKKTFQVGQHIEIGNLKGEIVQITNISVFIKDGGNIVVIPSHKLITSETIIKA